MTSNSTKIIAANKAFSESRRVVFQEMTSTMLLGTKQVSNIFFRLPICARLALTGSSMKALKLNPELLSNYNDLVTLGTESAQKTFSQVQKAAAISQSIIPTAAELKSLDGANDLTISHFEALTALSTEQVKVTVNTFFDVFRHAYASLVGFKIVPNSLIASAKFERAISAHQDRALEITGQLNEAMARATPDRVT